jgi:hypothetical protein
VLLIGSIFFLFHAPFFFFFCAAADRVHLYIIRFILQILILFTEVLNAITNVHKRLGYYLVLFPLLILIYDDVLTIINEIYLLHLSLSEYELVSTFFLFI